MGTFLGITLAVFAVLWIWAKWQTVRALRLIDSDWTIQSSLRPHQLHELVGKGAKGLNPLAHVAQPEQGVYQRWISRGFGKWSRNRAQVLIRLLQTDDPRDRDTLIHCAISRWEGVGFLGIRSVSAVFACRRRIKAIIGAIQAADPSSVVLADPARPELMAPSAGA